MEWRAQIARPAFGSYAVGGPRLAGASTTRASGACAGASGSRSEARTGAGAEGSAATPVAGALAWTQTAQVSAAPE